MCYEIKSRAVDAVSEEPAASDTVVRVASLRRSDLSKGLETCADLQGAGWGGGGEDPAEGTVIQRKAPRPECSRPV